ncbi:MAG: glutathione peroxidase [Kordiimonadaceae bacterium]|nr:glutathione peroxidase [Kordiimonadaceae bacterium]
MGMIVGFILAVSVSAHVGAAEPKTAHDFMLKSIDYTDLPLSQYAGKAVLVVNTASLCGFTPQYEGLQKLWIDYKDKGLIVLGVPANDFGSQEPDSEADIKKFCEVNFQVDFPMTKKMVVKGGKDTAEIYDWFAEMLGEDSRPKWNFHKYLINRNGNAVAFFPSDVKPNSQKLLAAIDKVLAE